MTDTKPISIFDLAETDTSAEEDGRWFKDVFGDETNIDLKLRRMTSKAAMKARRNLEKGYRKHLKNGVYPDDIAIDIMTEHLAKGVVVDWKGLYDRDGNVIEFSPEAALTLLKKLPTLRDMIAVMAQNLDNFRVEAREDTAKN